MFHSAIVGQRELSVVLGVRGRSIGCEGVVLMVLSRLSIRVSA